MVVGVASDDAFVWFECLIYFSVYDKSLVASCQQMDWEEDTSGKETTWQPWPLVCFVRQYI